MDAAISPYEIATRTPGALAALLLADSVTTLAPQSPGAGRAAASPRLHQLLESWAWTRPLWPERVLAREYRGVSPMDDVRAVAARIAADPALARLADIIDTDLLADHERFTDALCADLLRGGGDPRLSVPVNAGIDAFASRLRLVEFVSPAPSLTGRLESRAPRGLFKLSLPVLTRASGTAVLAARELLAGPLGVMRRRFDELRDLLDRGDHAAVQAFARDRLEPAARDLERATLEARAELTDLTDPGSPLEPQLGHVALTGALVDPAASLAAGAAALESMARPRGTMRPAGSAGSPQVAAGLALPPVLTLSVRSLPWDI